MSKKIPWKKVQEIEEIKIQINALYVKLEEEEAKLFKKYGECESVFEIEPDENDCKWLRFRISDNAKKLSSGQICFKTTSFKPVEIEIKRLKKEPKAA